MEINVRKYRADMDSTVPENIMKIDIETCDWITWLYKPNKTLSHIYIYIKPVLSSLPIYDSIIVKNVSSYFKQRSKTA